MTAADRKGRESADLTIGRDAAGLLWAKGEPALLAEYLECDLQSSLYSTREVLAVAAAVAAGEREDYEATGNAFTLKLTRRTARIEHLWTDEPVVCRLPLTEFRDAVERWLELIESPDP